MVVALPRPAAALSCMNPAELLKQYATQDDYTVALITAGAIETVGDQHDQIVTIDTMYKGMLNTTDTVSFTFDQTWNYLCAGEPASAGTPALYVLSDKQVIQVFATDSELATNLLTLIETPAVQPTEITVEEADRQNLMKQIISLLQQIVTLLTPSAAMVGLK